MFEKLQSIDAALLLFFNHLNNPVFDFFFSGSATNGFGCLSMAFLHGFFRNGTPIGFYPYCFLLES